MVPSGASPFTSPTDPNPEKEGSSSSSRVLDTGHRRTSPDDQRASVTDGLGLGRGRKGSVWGTSFKVAFDASLEGEGPLHYSHINSPGRRPVGGDQRTGTEGSSTSFEGWVDGRRRCQPYLGEFRSSDPPSSTNRDRGIREGVVEGDTGSFCPSVGQMTPR